MSERLQKLEQEFVSKSSDLAMWRGLVMSDGFKIMKKDMELQRNYRLLTVGGSPLASFSGVLPQEFMKGEANGIGLALTYPLLQVENLQMDVERLTVAIETEKENVQTSGTTVGRDSRVTSEQWHGE